ncbi:MAG: hypothetical protein Q8R00_03700 [Candidatus Nanoarchaeia archaeon]|nr:hypothetical protein [Candidatus Nanoarchaeia archaeon]
MNKLIFILGVLVVIVAALPLFPGLVPSMIPTSGQNYQYTLMVLGVLVALIGLFSSGNGERNKIAKMLGFKE